jgi:hypothetical protein
LHQIGRCIISNSLVRGFFPFLSLVFGKWI